MCTLHVFFFLLCTNNSIFVTMIIGENMDSKKVAYILMTLSFILIISGSFSTVVLSLKKDKEETYRRIYIVNDEFEVFSTNTSVFESFRDDLYNDFLSNFYFDTLYQNDKEIKNRLSNYENIVDEIEKNTKQLDSLCKEVYYPDSEANSKCMNYKTIYEQVVNYFLSDINLYNRYIKQYNEYAKEQVNYQPVQKYHTTKTFIDYNKDNQYDGKEE